MLGFAMIGLGFLGSPQVYVRFMSISDEKEIDKGKWVAIIFTLFTDAAAVTIGILGRIMFTKSGQDPEAILGNGAENVLSMLTRNYSSLYTGCCIRCNCIICHYVNYRFITRNCFKRDYTRPLSKSIST